MGRTAGHGCRHTRNASTPAAVRRRPQGQERPRWYDRAGRRALAGQAPTAFTNRNDIIRTVVALYRLGWGTRGIASRHFRVHRLQFQGYEQVHVWQVFGKLDVTRALVEVTEVLGPERPSNARTGVDGDDAHSDR